MRSILRLTTLAGAVLASACSDGATAPDASRLSRAEAIQLATRLSETTSDKLGMPSTSASASASLSRAEADPIDVTRSFEVPCELGGVVTIDSRFAFSADEETQSGSLEAEATVVHRDCAVSLEKGSVVLNGDPGLSVASHFSWANEAQEQPLRVTQAGRLGWARDSGETGTCEVELVAVTDLDARRRTVEGTLCGFRIDEETTWNPGGRG